MDINEYIVKRVDDQIDWYDKKSQSCQKNYKRIQISEIILAATIPILSGYTTVWNAIPVIIGIFGAIITILESITKLNKYHENWITYRATCEMLRYHKNLFQTHSGPYCEENHESIENLFVKNMEQIISAENNQWKSLNEKSNKPENSDKN